jgi:hypothetical protein
MTTTTTLSFTDILAGSSKIIETRTVIADAANDRAAGTVMGKISASGKYVEYDDDGTDDGRRIAIGVLMSDIPKGSADTKAPILLLGTVRRAALTGLDANGEEDLNARGVHMDTESLA